MSEQWVSQIAEQSGHPFLIGSKQRFGDRDVRVNLPDLSSYQQCAVVIIDDVISSGQTILKCIVALQAQGIEWIKCASVQGIFANGADAQLPAAGLDELATTNTIVHRSNVMDITPLLIDPVGECLRGQKELAIKVN